MANAPLMASPRPDPDRPPIPPRWSATRLFVTAFLILAALLLWRFYSPYNVPAIVELIDEDAKRLWAYPYFEFGRLAVTPAFLTKTFVFLLVMALFSNLVMRFVEAQLLAAAPLEGGRRYALARVIGYAVFLLGVLLGIEAAGLDLSTFAVFGGAIGIGVGFGLQTIANNFVSGLVLLADGAIKVGDRVEVGDLVGNVTKIGPRAAWVETNGSRVVIVPNSELVSKPVTNWTANHNRVRFSLPVNVSYGADLHRASRAILEVAARHPDTLASPPPEIACTDFSSSSVTLELRVWNDRSVRTSTNYLSDLRIAIFDEFRAQGMEFPFPQLDLHVQRKPGRPAAA